MRGGDQKSLVPISSQSEDAYSHARNEKRGGGAVSAGTLNKERKKSLILIRINLWDGDVQGAGGATRRGVNKGSKIKEGDGGARAGEECLSEIGEKKGGSALYAEDRRASRRLLSIQQRGKKIGLKPAKDNGGGREEKKKKKKKSRLRRGRAHLLCQRGDAPRYSGRGEGKTSAGKETGKKSLSRGGFGLTKATAANG